MSCFSLAQDQKAKKGEKKKKGVGTCPRTTMGFFFDCDGAEPGFATGSDMLGFQNSASGRVNKLEIG